MKSRLLGVVSGCVLAITATLSNASTLFTANYDGIWEIDPSTGLGQNFTTIDAIALSYGDGYLFESDGNDISRYNVSLGTWASLSGRNANVIAYGDGVLYTNNSGSGNGIIAIDAVTGTASTLNGLNGVTALAFGGNSLYAANYSGIWEFDPTTGIGSQFSTITAVALSYGNGSLYVSDNNQISRYDIAMDTWTLLNGHNADSIAYGDGVLYVNDSNSGNNILAVDSESGSMSTLNSLPGVTALAYQATVIPIPPAAWLFASGLLGLVGMARRNE